MIVVSADRGCGCASQVDQMFLRITMGFLLLTFLAADPASGQNPQQFLQEATDAGGDYAGNRQPVLARPTPQAYEQPPTTAPLYAGYDRLPASVASPYPDYHRNYYRQTRYNPAYTLPPSSLPLFPARTSDWNPSRSLWYSARSVPWYSGYWYYPRYLRTTVVVPANSAGACEPLSFPDETADLPPNPGEIDDEIDVWPQR